jgi:hypothetical protein
MLSVAKFPSKVIDELRSILKLRTRDPRKKERVVDILTKYYSFSYTKQKLMKLKGLIQIKIKKLGNNPRLETVF